MYETLNDLPDHLQNDLPEGAQEVYLERYQEAWDEYDEDQGGDLGQHGVAHRNAMVAVKKSYIKDNDGVWHDRDEYEPEDEEEGLTANFDIRDTGGADTATEEVEESDIDDTDDAAVDEDGDPATMQDDKPVAARH